MSKTKIILTCIAVSILTTVGILAAVAFMLFTRIKPC